MHSGQTRPRQTSKQSKNTSEKLFRVLLDDSQFERLAQINLQFQGPYAVDSEQFTKEVSMSEEQITAVQKARTKKPDLGFDQIRELIGESTTKKWQELAGDTFPFRRGLGRFRMSYLVQRQRAENFRRRRSASD